MAFYMVLISITLSISGGAQRRPLHAVVSRCQFESLVTFRLAISGQRRAGILACFSPKTDWLSAQNKYRNRNQGHDSCCKADPQQPLCRRIQVAMLHENRNECRDQTSSDCNCDDEQLFIHNTTSWLTCYYAAPWPARPPPNTGPGYRPRCDWRLRPH